MTVKAGQANLNSVAPEVIDKLIPVMCMAFPPVPKEHVGVEEERAQGRH